MIIKGNSAKLELVCTTGADLHVHASTVEAVDSATTGKGTPYNQIITAAGTYTIIPGIGDTTSQRVRHVQIRNVDASVSNGVTVLHYTDSGVGDGNVAACEQFNVVLLPGESMTFDGGKWTHNPANYGTPMPIKQILASDHSSSSTTPDSVTGLKVVNVQPGTYKFQYVLLHQAAATTTGIRFDVNFTGTATGSWIQRFVDVSATASTGAQDQDAVLSTGSVVGAFASRAFGTAGRGTTISVDTANADMLTIIEGLLIVTAAGDLELWHGSEVAAATTVKAGSLVLLT